MQRTLSSPHWKVHQMHRISCRITQNAQNRSSAQSASGLFWGGSVQQPQLGNILLWSSKMNNAWICLMCRWGETKPLWTLEIIRCIFQVTITAFSTEPKSSGDLVAFPRCSLALPYSRKFSSSQSWDFLRINWLDCTRWSLLELQALFLQETKEMFLMCWDLLFK